MSSKTDTSELDPLETDKKNIRIRSIHFSKKSSSQDEPPLERNPEQEDVTLDILKELPWQRGAEIVIRRCTVLLCDQLALHETWRMRSNVTRAHNLVSGILGSEEPATGTVLAALLQAQEETQRRPEEKITTRNSDGTANKMPYFFQRLAACLQAAQERKEAEQWAEITLYEQKEDRSSLEASQGEEMASHLDDEDQEMFPRTGNTDGIGEDYVHQAYVPEKERSGEEKEERVKYTRKIRTHLRNWGVLQISSEGHDGTEIDREHRCGCPLYIVKGLRRTCAHCMPDPSWDQQTQNLIASILDH